MVLSSYGACMKNDEISSNAAEIGHTAIFSSEHVRVEYPHCVLPPHFFERVMYLKRTAAVSEMRRARTVLSVQSWDGRDVLSVLSD